MCAGKHAVLVHSYITDTCFVESEGMYRGTCPVPICTFLITALPFPEVCISGKNFGAHLQPPWRTSCHQNSQVQLKFNISLNNS